jgi:hypothetical protein
MVGGSTTAARAGSPEDVRMYYRDIAKESVEFHQETFPMQRPVPVTGEVSQMFRDALAARGIEELRRALRLR